MILPGCRMIGIFQMTPLPLETETPQLKLNQVTDIPTLPPVTATPTLPIGAMVRYMDPGDIFTQVKAEMMPQKGYQQVVIFGTVTGFLTRTDEWGNMLSTGEIELAHHSGVDFRVTCDDFCFMVDAHKNLLPRSALEKGSEVIIFGAADEAVTNINADMIAIHTLAPAVDYMEPDLSAFPNDMTYTEYALAGFPQMSPIRVQAAPVTDTPTPASTDEVSDENTGTDSGYGYDYGYDYGYYDPYFRPTSTPNRPPTVTPTPEDPGVPQIQPTEDLNDRLTERLTHSLEGRSGYSIGAYGEKYSVYLEYDQDQNRDPRYPTRALADVESNAYTFTEYYIPYVHNPMFVNWGVVNYGGDWYLPLRLTVDIDTDPNVVDIVYTDRTLRSQRNYDEEMGYLRSFGYSIIMNKLFYFYQKENGYGISINRQDFDLGFDDIPFGYVSGYTEIDPFYSDDLITFFGHRGGKWYYVELRENEAMKNNYYW